MAYDYDTNTLDIAEIIENGLKKVDDKLNAFDEELTEMKADFIALGQKTAQGYSGNFGKPADPISKIVNSDEIKGFVASKGVKNASFTLDGGIKTLLTKSTLVGDTSAGGNDLYSVQGQRDNRLANNPQRRLSIFEVLPMIPVNSNSFEYNSLDGYANAAAYQTAEGATKAEGSMPTELITAPITTIAHWLPISDQVLADSPVLSTQVDSLLRYGVMAKASAEIIAGSTAGRIQGLATQATAYAYASSTALADAIGEGITWLDLQGWQADLVIINPSDWFTIVSERTTTEKDYVAGGWANPNPRSIWGVNVITDPSVSPGNPIILDSSQVAILDRLQTRVEMGRSGTGFVDNVTTILGEMRIGLAVFSPSAVLILSSETD